MVIGIYSIDTYKKQAKLKLADKYNFTSINFKTENPQKTIEDLTDIVKANDTTYSPLALYFLIDNNLIESRDEINLLFDEVINKTKLDKEIKNPVPMNLLVMLWFSNFQPAPYKHFKTWHKYNYENINRVLVEARKHQNLKEHTGSKFDAALKENYDNKKV